MPQQVGYLVTFEGDKRVLTPQPTPIYEIRTVRVHAGPVAWAWARHSW
jgi:hypothetical protein